MPGSLGFEVWLVIHFSSRSVMYQQEGEAKLPISSSDLALVPMPGASSEWIWCQMGPSGAQKQDRQDRNTIKFGELYCCLESCGCEEEVTFGC